MKPLTPDARRAFETATVIFQEDLRDSESATYLQSRGFNGETAQRFRLGHVPQDVDGWEKFVGMLAIPNINAAGIVVNLKFRDLNPEAKPKYTARSGEERRIFNASALRTILPYVAVTEGELDAIALEQAGVPALSIPSGAQSWKAHHARMLGGFDRILIAVDSDEPGQLLAQKLLDSVPQAVPVHWPSGIKDANQMLQEAGADALRELVTK